MVHNKELSRTELEELNKKSHRQLIQVVAHFDPNVENIVVFVNVSTWS